MKNLTLKSAGGFPWEVSVFPSGDPEKNPKWIINVNPNSYIWRSFNLKDVMVCTGFLDRETDGKIKEAEGITSGHYIVGLNQDMEIKKNQMVVLVVKTGPNLYPVSAEVKILGDEGKNETPWIGWPEPFIFNPPLKYEEDGTLKDPEKTRYCFGAYHIIGYLTYDPSKGGKSLIFDKENQYFVQLLKDNLLMSAFNYEGIPVTYGIPFHAPYLDFDKKQLDN